MTECDGQQVQCCKCKTSFFLPDSLYKSAKASEEILFYCPYGHPQHFPDGVSEAEKLRLERDRLAQRIAQRDDEIRLERDRRGAVERQLSAQRGVVTRIKNRVGHGVCPCCSRNFKNLHRHMKSKHPNYSKSDVVLATNGAAAP